MENRDSTATGKAASEMKGWIFVLVLAVGFLVYGLFIFAYMGDKGPPGWDFGDVADTPGQSVYSTAPEPAGSRAAPSPQHVAETPSQAPGENGREK